MATTRDPSFLPTAMVPTLTLTRLSPSFDRSSSQHEPKRTPPSSSTASSQQTKPVPHATVKLVPPSVPRPPAAISPIQVLGGGGRVKRAGVLTLPLTRIRTVMKTAPNSNAIGLNSSVALAKAAVSVVY